MIIGIIIIIISIHVAVIKVFDVVDLAIGRLQKQCSLLISKGSPLETQPGV